MAIAKNTQTLLEVIQSLSSVRTMDEVMRMVRSAAREIAQADGATFVLKDDVYCFYADEDAIEPLWKGQRFPLTACVSGWVMNHREQIVIEDIYKDDRVPIDAYRPTFVKSLAMTPIRSKDPIGAIGAYWSQIHRPSEEQLELLQALANTTSVAIENVNLYQRLEDRIEELKKANHAKNEFLTTLSHELRTPMNSIVGWSEMLKDSDVDEDDKTRGAETIYRNAVNQTHVIDDLLDISQMVSGKFNIQRESIRLGDCVKKALQSVRDEAEAKHIPFQFVDRVGKAQVLGDSNRLQQLFVNLLKNAIKFSPTYQPVQVVLDKFGPHYRVQVIDHGIGIDEHTLPHIFEIFKQADGSMVRKHGGLGLGLSIAQHLAEAHRGEIKVDSAGAGEGATFSVLIPALAAEHSRVEKEQAMSH